MFQNYNLVKELTGWENILLPVMLDSHKPDEEYLKRITSMLGVDNRFSVVLFHVPLTGSHCAPSWGSVMVSVVHWPVASSACTVSAARF